MRAKSTPNASAFTVERFWATVAKGDGPDSCWIWTGTLFSDGYGRIHWNRKTTGAHRVAWELMHGPIPDGMMVLHNCPGAHDKRCVRHLYLGTNLENAADRERLGQQIHKFGEDNPQAKLTWGKVREIRRRYAENSSEGMQTRLAHEFGVSGGTIQLIVRCHTWPEKDGVLLR